MKNKLGIVVPYFNTTPEIRKSLFESFNNQTDKNFDLYLVSDHSSSEQEMKELFNTSDLFVHYLSTGLNDNLGPWYAKNFGLETSTNDWIMFFDCDDYINDINLISNLNEKLRNKKIYDIITFYISNNSNEFKKRILTIRKEFLLINNLKFPPIVKEEDTAFGSMLYLLEPKTTDLDNKIHGIYNYKTVSGINVCSWETDNIGNMITFLTSLAISLEWNIKLNIIKGTPIDYCTIVDRYLSAQSFYVKDVEFLELLNLITAWILYGLNKTYQRLKLPYFINSDLINESSKEVMEVLFDNYKDLKLTGLSVKELKRITGI